MSLFRKKTPAAPVAAAEKPKRPKTPHQQGNDFIQSAEEFEKSEIDAVRRQSKTAWSVAGVAVLMAAAATFAVAALAPLKSVEPFIVRVDNNTGYTDVISTLKHQTVENDEVMNNYWLGKYVEYREGYDWYTVQDTYDATMLLSAPQEQEVVNRLFNSEYAPHKVLTDKYQVKVKIKMITYLGGTAQVRFEKIRIPTSQATHEAPVTQNMMATIAFGYENGAQNEKERLVNPLGFQAVSYRADMENAQ